MRAITLSAVVAISLVLTVSAQDTRVPPTQSAPTFSKDVPPWARAIRDKVSTRTMPPWFADPAHGVFKNDRSLTQAQIDTIVKWVDADARQGDPAQLPPLPAFTDGWQIGKPDMVFEMPTEF